MKRKLLEAHMRAAYVYAELSYCKRKQVGCVIVKHDSVIAIGYNGTPPGDDNCCEDESFVSVPDIIHAEDNALRKLTRLNEGALGSTVFVTLAPCKPCAVRLADAGVEHVYYTESYGDEGIRYLKRRGVKVEQLEL